MMHHTQPQSYFGNLEGLERGGGELLFYGFKCRESFVIPLEGFVLCKLRKRGHDIAKVRNKDPCAYLR